ncbi:MAG: DUF445 family protein [Spirochaetales bacterium]|nr:DUF445 family protein [Spirochaetales bacterium]
MSVLASQSGAVFWAQRVVPLLPWVLPPVLGAIIGYVTNAIAIRMLFRPLREIRIFGVRLPLTPGVIPRQRHQLADNIGQMVSRELLDVQSVRRHLSASGFQERIRVNLEQLFGELMSSPLSSFRFENRELVFSSIETFLSDGLHGFFSSRSFIHGVRTILARVVTGLADKRLDELLGSAPVSSFLRDRLLPALAMPDTRRRIAQSVRRWLEERDGGAAPLASLVPPQLLVTVAQVVRALMPSLFDAGFQWLGDEKTRGELNTRGKRLLRQVLERLNVLQRFLISAGQFDRTLESRMPQIIDDALAELRDYAYRPETLDQLEAVIADGLQRWRSRPPSAKGAGGIDPEAAEAAVERLLAGLEDAATRERLAAGLERLLSKQGPRSLRELLSRTLHLQESEIVEFSATHVLGYLSRKETANSIAAEIVGFSRRFVEENQDKTVGELLHVGPQLRERASAGLTTQLLRIVDNRLPALLESFDVRELVVTKIDNLDVGQVERLLMIVIARHLKWINVFGAVLGAIIGFSQMILRLVT